jgi:hypothetical protein
MPKTAEQKAARKEKKKMAKAMKLSMQQPATAGPTITPARKRGNSITKLVGAINGLVKSQTKLAGRGGYVADTGAWLGKRGGQLLENTSIGRGINTAAQLLGRGAYTLRKNDIMTASTGVPTFATRKDYVEMDFREFFCNVNGSGSTAWAIQQSFNINAGLASSLPLLSQTGMNFEEVEWMSLVVIYEAVSGSITTTQALGSVSLATQYDLQDPAFSTEQEMLDYEYATVTKPDCDCIHPIECDPRQNASARFFTRTGLLNNTTTTVDARYNAYDLGRFSVALSGCSAPVSATLGKLYWVGKVRFYKPKLYQWLGSSILHDSFLGMSATTSGGVIVNFNGAGETSPGSSSTLGGFIGGNTAAYYFPANVYSGCYLIAFNVGLASGTFGQALSPVVTNCTIAGSFLSTATAATVGTLLYLVKVSAINASVNFGSAITTGSASGGTCNLWVVQTYPLTSGFT